MLPQFSSVEILLKLRFSKRACATIISRRSIRLFQIHLNVSSQNRCCLLPEHQAAGLGSLPGGGAEILVDRVRNEITRGKVMTDDWLDVMRVWHKLGGHSSATMMFGHVETMEERIEHLDRLRELQDETGGFTAFI